MPYSSDAFDHYIDTLIGLLRPATVCDIGPGAGKYSRIIRNRANLDQFSVELTGVEIDESYVREFNLHEKYDKIIVGNAIKIIDSPRNRYDFVIIGDCIEHMKKSEGLDLLNFLIYRAGYICVVYPDQFIQDDLDGHAAEAHISTWSEADFTGWKTLHHAWSGMHLFLIKGYQPSRMTITG
jgi:phospholipid N-methyltransferase